MNREIKFRAWTKRDKCWISGFSIHQSGLFSDMINAKIEEPQHIAVADAHWQELSKQDDVIVMQFTGLKDKNGVEIYEGDIGKDVNDDIYEIKFQDGAFIALLDGNVIIELSEVASDIEVFGNIYQNKDLLNI